MILKALTYLFLTPARPHYYLNIILNILNNKRIANTSIIISTLLVSAIFLLREEFQEFSKETVIWFFGFLIGFLVNIFLDIYLIAMMISKMKNKEISFGNAKLIVAFSILPVLLLFFFKFLFPYSELADFYFLIFGIWYVLLLISAIKQIYSVKIVQASVIVFNIIIIKFIFSFLFYSRIY